MTDNKQLGVKPALQTASEEGLFRFNHTDLGVEVESCQQGLNFTHSFLTGALLLRARQSTQALLKACNNKSRNIKTILDMTAGWGADSLCLAQHGKQVTMLEQNETLYGILDYSLKQLKLEKPAGNIASNLNLKYANSFDYLQALSSDNSADETYDCIYLDPMFPSHKSSAKPAKEMQILQLMTRNIDIDSCFELALQKALRRVVVKRPLKAGAISEIKPDLCYREKTIRFDIYITKV